MPASSGVVSVSTLLDRLLVQKRTGHASRCALVSVSTLLDRLLVPGRLFAPVHSQRSFSIHSAGSSSGSLSDCGFSSGCHRFSIHSAGSSSGSWRFSARPRATSVSVSTLLDRLLVPTSPPPRAVSLRCFSIHSAGSSSGSAALAL